MKAARFAALAAATLGLAIEAYFVRELFLGTVGAGSVALHFLGGAAGGLGLAGLSPARSGRRPLTAFFVAGTLLLPMVGLVGAAIAVLGPAWLPRKPELPNAIVPVPLLELPERGAQAPEPPRLGGASAFGRLRHARNIVDRMDAVIAMRGVDERSAVPVLKLGLRDSADEVRLLAFTLLQERERAYYADIHDLKGKLGTASAQEASVLRTRIAQAYWELAYQDLVQGELLAFALDEAGKFLSEALAARPRDVGNTLLLGRIRLRQHRLDDAARLFEEARALGMPDAVVRPQQAELAFLSRDFPKTRAYLSDIPPESRKLAVIGDLVEFWT